MTPLGLVTFVAIAACLRNWRERMPWLLAVSLALPVSAALVVPGVVLPPYFLIASTLAGLAGWSWLRGELTIPRAPQLIWLAAFVGWCYFITAIAPTLFSGLTVFNQTDTSDGQIVMAKLGYSSSNIAQLAYLTVSAVVIVYFATRERVSPHLLLPGLGAAIGLSFWRLLHDKVGLPYPASFIDSANYLYIDINTDSDYRLRGVFTEPSTLAHYATATLAVCLVMLYRRQPWQLRIAYSVVAVLAAVDIIYARSGTALVGGTVVALGVGVSILIRATKTYHGTLAVALTTCALAVVVVLLFHPISQYVVGLFTNKRDSGSYQLRVGGDRYSLSIIDDIYGLGVGLGSNKTSSLWPMLLSCVGVIGTALFIGLIVSVLLGAVRRPLGVAAVAATFSIIVTKSVAGYFLSEPLLMLGLAICTCVALQPPSTERPDEADDEIDAALGRATSSAGPVQ